MLNLLIIQLSRSKCSVRWPLADYSADRSALFSLWLYNHKWLTVALTYPDSELVVADRVPHTRVFIDDVVKRKAELARPVDDLLANFNAFIRQTIVDHRELLARL